MSQLSLLPAFGNPVHDAQVVFRAVLKAMSEPGIQGNLSSTSVSLDTSDSALHPTTWAIAQALFDHDTTIYLSPEVNSEALVRSLQFQTDAKVTPVTEQADFAIVTMDELVDLDQFHLGSLEAPHESCTVIVQVEAFDSPSPVEISGPGIPDSRMLEIAHLSQKQLELIQANHRLYPCGLDFVFCSPGHFLALPRTTRLHTRTPSNGESTCM